MADETTAPETGEVTTTPPPEATEQHEATPETVVEQQPADDTDALKSALAKANKDGERVRRRLKELEDRDKTEAEKLTERADSAEKRAEVAEGRLLRLEVASSKGLPAELVARMQGSSREELEADADELLTLVKPVKPTGGFDGGPRGSNESTTSKTPAEAHNDFLSDVFSGRARS